MEDNFALRYVFTYPGIISRAELVPSHGASRRRLGHKDPAFISEGFNNSKKAIENFKLHQTSHTHVLSVNQIAAVKRP
jgi:hypothetical protein